MKFSGVFHVTFIQLHKCITRTECILGPTEAASVRRDGLYDTYIRMSIQMSLTTTFTVHCLQRASPALMMKRRLSCNIYSNVKCHLLSTLRHSMQWQVPALCLQHLVLHHCIYSPPNNTAVC